MEEETLNNIINTQKIEIGTTFSKNYNCFNCFKHITKKEYTSKSSHLPRIILKDINTKLNKEYLVQVIIFNSIAKNICYEKEKIFVHRLRPTETRKMDTNVKYAFVFNAEKDDSENCRYVFRGLYKLIHKDKVMLWERQNQKEKTVLIDEESIINSIKNQEKE